MIIPEVLRDNKFRFVKLGTWHDYKNKKGEVEAFFPKSRDELKSIIKKGWNPQGKRPQENDWQKTNNYSYQDMMMWLGVNPAKNYGILTGINGLGVLDDDTENKELLHLFSISFPKTFLSRDHNYIFLDGWDGKKIIFYNQNKEHCGELQGLGQQVVAPNSHHPLAENYDIRKNIPIITIDYKKFCEVFKDYLPKKIRKVVTDFKKTNWEGDSITDIPITNIISLSGLTDVGGGCYQGPHPQHGSVNGMNFRVDTSSNSWYCFRCSSGGGPSELIGVVDGIIDCSQAGSNCYSSEQGREVIEIAREKYGLKAPEKQTNFKPMGWALSINIKKMAERKKFTDCPNCNIPFEFNEELGFYKCNQCGIKGGLKKFSRLCLVNNK